MNDDKLKLHILAFKTRFPERANLLEKAIQNNDTEEVNRLLKELYQSTTGFPIIPSENVLSLTPNQIALPDATRTTGTLTPAAQQEYNIGQAGGIAGVLDIASQQNAEDLIKQREAYLDKKSDELLSQRDFFDRLSLAGKTVQNTLFDMGVNVLETAGLLIGGAANQFNEDAGQSIISGIAQFGQVLRDTYKIREGITPEDEFIMNRNTAYQVINGLTFTGAFLLGGVLTSGLPKLASYGIRSVLATQESTQEALKSFEETKNIDTAISVYVAGLPADFSEFAIDRLVPEVKVALKGMTPLYRRALDTVIGAGQGFLMEGGQEVFQQWWHNLTAKEIYDNNRRLSEGLEQSFTVGGLVGLLFGGAFRLTALKLQDPNLTPQERKLLERSTERMGTVLSRFDLDAQIRQSLPQGTSFYKFDPTVSSAIKRAIDKSQTETEALPVINTKGEVIYTNPLEIEKLQASEKIKSAATTFDKLGGLTQYTLAKVKEGLQTFGDFSAEITNQFGKSVTPFLPALYELATSPLGLAFLSYLNANPDLINDPTIISALILPVGVSSKLGFAKEDVVGTIRTLDNQQLEVLHPSVQRFTDDLWRDLETAFNDIDVHGSANLVQTLGKYFVTKQPIETPRGKLNDITIKIQGDARAGEDWVGAYTPSTNELTLNAGVLRKIRNDRGTILHQFAKFNLPNQAELETLSTKELFQLLVTNTILHETQHYLDRSFGVGGGGSGETFMRMPNEVVNNFVEAQYPTIIAKLTGVQRFLERVAGNNLVMFLEDFDAEAYKQLSQTSVDALSDEEYRNFISNLIDVVTTFPLSANAENMLQQIAQNYRNKNFVKDILTNRLFPTIDKQMSILADVKSLQHHITTVKRLHDNRPQHWGKSVIGALNLINNYIQYLDFLPQAQLPNIPTLLYERIGGETRAKFNERQATAYALSGELLPTTAIPTSVIEVKADHSNLLNSEQELTSTYREFFDTLSEVINEAMQTYGQSYNPIVEQISRDYADAGYTVARDSEGNVLISYSELTPQGVSQAIQDYYSQRIAADVSIQLENLFRQRGQKVNFSDIWNIAKDGKYNNVDLTNKETLDETLDTILKDIKNTQPTKSVIDVPALTRYTGISQNVYGKDYPKTVVLESTIKAQGVDTEKVYESRPYFYSVTNPTFYNNTLEAFVTAGNKTPHHIVLPLQDIYFFNQIDEYEGNSLGLSGDPDVMYKILKQKGYKGAIYKTPSGEYQLTTFEPLNIYQKPSTNIQQDKLALSFNKLTHKFSQGIINKVYDDTSVNDMRAIIEKSLITEFGSFSPYVTRNMKTTPTITAFGDTHIMGNALVELAVPMDNLNDVVRAVAVTGKKLKQTNAHIYFEGNRPANIPYGKVLPDKSQWQPMIQVQFDSITPEDAKQITMIFQQAGYNGVTVDIENNQAFIYHIGDNQNEINRFIQNGNELKQQLQSKYANARIEFSDIALWSFGQNNEWGAVAPYEEIENTVLPKSSTALQSVATTSLPQRAFIPSFESILSGNWDTAVKDAQTRVTIWANEEAQLQQDIGSSRIYPYTVAYVLGKVLNEKVSIQSAMNSLFEQIPTLKQLETTLYGKVLEGASALNNSGISSQEAEQVRNSFNEIIYADKLHTVKVGNITITNDGNVADKTKGRVIYIEPNAPYQAEQDADFLRYVKDFIRATYPSFNLSIALNSANAQENTETEARVLQTILKDLAPNNLSKQWDGLLLKYRTLNADNFIGRVSFKNNDTTITTDVTVPLGNAYKVANYNANFKVLENLMSMTPTQLVTSLKTTEFDKYIPQLEPTLLKEVWNTLTQGLTNPNELYDFTSIIGKLLQVGWNVLKAGGVLGRAFVNKMVNLFGEGIKSVAEKLYKPLRDAFFKRDEPTPAEPEQEFVKRLTGVEEGATRGFNPENLAKEIQDNYDLVDLEKAVKEAKGGRVSVIQAKQGAIKLINDGQVTLEKLDDMPYGNVLPAHYVLAYNVMAQEELGSALQQLKALKDKYGNNPIPANEVALITSVLAPALRRWAKVRSMISEAGRVIRMGGTERFDNYLDVLSAYKNLMSPELQDIIDKLHELPEDKKDTDLLGLILYNFVLSNPETQLANIFGNTANLVANIVADFGFMPNITTKSVVQSFGRAIRLAKNDIVQMLAGVKEFENKFVDVKLTQGKLSKLLLPTTWLSIMDAIYRNFATTYKETQLYYKYKPEASLKYYRDLIDSIKSDNDNLILQLDPDTIEQYGQLLTTAEHFGKYITFQLPAESSLGRIFEEMARHPVLRFITLFAKVPLNIFKQGALYWTPIGIVSLAKKFANQDTIADKELAQQQLRTMTLGTALISAITYGLANGLLHITGDEPDDEFERELLRARGFKPYHIYIRQDDGSYKGVTYRWAEPIAIIPYIVATVKDLYTNPKYRDKLNDVDILQRTSLLFASTFNYIRDANFMTGINEIFKMGESPKSASQYLERLLVNYFVPNAFAFQTNAPDWLRELTGINFKGKELYVLNNIWDRLKNKIGFGLQEDLTPRTDFFGQQQYNVFERTPFRVSQAGDIGEDAFIYKYLEKHSLRIPSLRQDALLKSLNADASVIERISTEIGKEMKPAIRELFKIAEAKVEQKYDKLTEDAQKRYGDEAVKLYKTIGQARIDETIQTAINTRYNALKTKVLMEMLSETQRKEAYRRLYGEAPDIIPEYEYNTDDEIILQIPKK